jgi:ABC-2 type transport system ATP-binding protein
VVRDARTVRTLISLTGQDAVVDELLTGQENLRLLGRLLHLPGHETAARSRELLKRFDLLDAASRPVKGYSGGMRRKLDLALSLLAQPRVLFLDEPTTGLDPRSRIAMWDVVRELADAGTTIFLITQYLEEADQLADEIVLIDHGRVTATGTPERLKRDLTGDAMELHFDTEATYQRAVRLLGPRAVADAISPRTLTVATRPGTEDVRLLLNNLAAAGVTVERMRLIEPSLDDVFLALTNRPAPVEKAA